MMKKKWSVVIFLLLCLPHLNQVWAQNPGASIVEKTSRFYVQLEREVTIQTAAQPTSDLDQSSISDRRKEIFKEVYRTNLEISTSSPGSASGSNKQTLTQTIFETDRLILEELYNTCNGSNWKRKANWLDASTSEWEGVGVNSDGRVTYLNLYYNNLSGTLPACLSGLAFLENLQLDGNDFTGTIPESYSNLQNLRWLSLNDNNLSGALPEWISGLVNLSGINLGGNEFTGSIPASWSNMQNLNYISLYYCKLSGDLPTFNGCAYLTTIQLGGNQFTGTIPAAWSALPLQYIYLYSNELSGGFPELSNYYTLRSIHLGDNNFTGSIPPSWSQLPALEEISLWGSNLSGNLPEFQGFTHLRFIELGNNNFTGNIPASWVNLPLEYLMVQSNDLTGNLPGWLSSLTNLRNISLGDNTFTGTIPVEWQSLTNLESLTLNHCNLEGAFPGWISNLTKLTNLTLSENLFVGEIPQSWSGLSSLGWLQLSGNSINGPLPEWIGELQNLVGLDLSRCGFTGTIPDNWSTLTKLNHLYLSRNQLSGNLPSWIGTFEFLRYLSFDENQFTGEVPESWSNLPELEQLNIYANKLSDFPALTGAVKLNYLHISNNSFDFGDIEPNIGLPKQSFQYSPQAKIGEIQNKPIKVGGQLALNSETPGLHNVYQWYKNSNPIPGAQEAAYLISNYQLTDAGIYTCRITNTLATQLTLESNSITVSTALEGNDLIGFKILGLTSCFGDMSNEVSGTYSGNQIIVSLKPGINPSNLNYSFTLSQGATVNRVAPGNGDFTNPVVFEVTSQAGVTKAYTVTVIQHSVYTEKKLLSFWFDSDNNPSIGWKDAQGVVNEEVRTIEVWIPWEGKNFITALKSSFILSENAVMVNNTGLPGLVIRQISGVTMNDFTHPKILTVYAEDCTSVDYVVTVKVIPNVNTDIKAFNFAINSCGCGLVNRIDPVLHRIYITLPSTIDISNFGPSSITLEPGATISLANTNPVLPWNTSVNWNNGPVVYTVTAPDGVTQENWSVLVENPPCKETNILSMSLLGNVQNGNAVIDQTNNTINLSVKIGTNLQTIEPVFNLPCGSQVLLGDGTQLPTSLDFSANPCINLIVKAQDPTISENWSICLSIQDLTRPTVSTLTSQAYNCTDQVLVQTNEPGRVFIVNENAINLGATPEPVCSYNLADWSSALATGVNLLVSNRMGAWATVTTTSSPIAISTHGLYSGTYRAFSVDNAGNISPVSTEGVQISICEVVVPTLCDLRNQPPVWRYTLTEEVFVTYEETRADGNWKFVQDASCGIQIEDRLGVLPTEPYGVGTGLTNISGTIDNSGVQLKLIPGVGFQPVINSTESVITPISLTYEEFRTNCYTNRQYESMLVKIATPIIAGNDYNQGLNWMYDNLDLNTRTAVGAYDWFLQSTFNTDLIGTPIQTTPCIYAGIRTNVNWGTIYGLLSPRGLQDIEPVVLPILSSTPSSPTIANLLPGQCGSTVVKIVNSGVGLLNIVGISLLNGSSDEFSFNTPVSIPFELDTWLTKEIIINFCPVDLGSETVVLLIETSNGQSLSVPIIGSTFRIVNTMPFCEYFNTWPDNVGSYDGWIGTGHSRRYGNGGFVAAIGDGRAYHINPIFGGTKFLISPGITIPADMNDPIVSWYQGKIFGTTSNTLKLFVSTDNQATWTQVYANNILQLNNVYSAGGPWLNAIVSLDAFKGKTVFLKWEASRTNGSFYWVVEDICIQSRITTPLIFTSPEGNFGCRQVGESYPLDFTIKNSGISILEVNSISVDGSMYSLVENNSYPAEIGAVTGEYAYGNNVLSQLGFRVVFNPTQSGIHSGRIIVDYGPDHQIKEFSLTGEAVSCADAFQTVIGENFAPKQNTWWKYTAAYEQDVTISSCHPNQAIQGTEYAWDTYLNVYSDCSGTLLAFNDDMETACSYNRASSGVTVHVVAGQTIYFFWPLAYPTSLHSGEGFYFTISLTDPPVVTVNFVANKLIINPGDMVNFTDLSTGSPNQWLWEFVGASIVTSTEQNPTGISYAIPGVYLVTLTASSEYSNSTVTKYNYISVIEPEQQEKVKWTDNFTIGGLKVTTTGADNGWTFVDNTNFDMKWQVRNFGVSGCSTNEDWMHSSTGETGYLVLPADEYNCKNGSPAANEVDAYAQSPGIDCSGLDVVILKYEQRFKTCCNNGKLEVQVSMDFGNNWKSYDVKGGRPENTLVGNPVEIMEINITEVASRQPDVRIRFYWKGSTQYFWMIDDMVLKGYTICNDFSATISGASQLYYGYAPMATTDLIPAITGGIPPYTFKWSTGEISEIIKVSPMQTTDYTLVVNDAQGCAATTSFLVNVEDVRCGNKMDKVLLCVNDNNPHTVCINASAVPAQLNKENYLGNCKKIGLLEGAEEKTSEMKVLLFPNPSVGSVNLEITGIASERAVLSIKDILGRTIHFEQVPTPDSEIKRTLELYQKGVYQVIIQTDTETITKQVVIIR